MPEVVIFAGGAADPVDFLRAATPAGAYVIAADRGARYALDAGLRPDLLVGDCDSLDDAAMHALQGIEVEIHPPEKDASDLELALKRARPLGPARILCAMGGRLDHLLTNVMLLLHARDAVFLSPHTEVSLAREVTGCPGDIVTLIPLSPVRGVTTEGLQYPLCEADLAPGTSLGLSNVMLSTRAGVTVREGDLLMVVQRCTVPL